MTNILTTCFLIDVAKHVIVSYVIAELAICQMTDHL